MGAGEGSPGAYRKTVFGGRKNPAPVLAACCRKMYLLFTYNDAAKSGWYKKYIVLVNCLYCMSIAGLIYQRGPLRGKKPNGYTAKRFCWTTPWQEATTECWQVNISLLKNDRPWCSGLVQRIFLKTHSYSVTLWGVLYGYKGYNPFGINSWTRHGNADSQIKLPSQGIQCDLYVCVCVCVCVDSKTNQLCGHRWVTDVYILVKPQHKNACLQEKTVFIRHVNLGIM